MAGVIKIDFKVGNMADVERALAGISTAARNSASRAAREQAKAGQQQVSQAKSNQAKMLSDAEAAAQAQIGIIRKVNKARVEAAKSQLTLEKELASEASRIESERANAASKARADRAADIAQRKTAAATARAEARATMAAAKEVAAVAENKRSNRMAVASGAAGGFKAGVGIIGAGFSMAAGQAVRQQMGLEERAALLRSASGKSAGEFDSVSKAKGISNLTGVSADEVMGGFEKLSGKAGGGGLTEYTDKFQELAKVAHGAGVNMSDLGDTLGTLYNRGVKADSVVKVVESLVQQGKDGAVEFNQLAVLLDASSGALGRFKMDDATRVMTAGGLSQFARTFGKKSAEEATDAVGDLARDISSKADTIQKLTGGTLTRVHTKGKKTKAMVNGKMVETTVGDSTKDAYAGGVEVGTDSTRAQMRDVNALLPEIIEGAAKAGNISKLLGEGGFTGNSTSIIGPLIQAFSGGISKNKEGRYELTGAGGTADVTGRAAVEALLTQFQSAGVAPGTSQKAFDDRMAQSQAKMNVTIEKLKNDLGTQLAPIASKAIENPKTAAAGLVAALTVGGAAKAGADVAGAALLEKIFPKTVANMSVTAANVVVGGAGGAAGAAGSAASGAGTAATGAAAGGASRLANAGALGVAAASLYGQYKLGEYVTGEGKRLNDTGDAAALAAKIRSGQATPGERDQAEVMAKRMEMQGGGFLSRVSGAMVGNAQQMKTDGVSLASVGRLITGAPSAISAAVQSTPGDQANAKGASEDLKAALAGMKQDPAAMGAAMAGPIAEAVGTAVAAASLQTTKVQPP